MTPIKDITGIILAGGAGHRVGHRDKGLITWQGKPLVAHVSACLRPQVGEIVISCNRNLSRYEEFAEQVVADNRQDFQGPLAGLEAAAAYVRTAFLVVVGCDMPLLPPDFVPRLISPLLYSVEGAEISYAHDGERSQYLCAAMRRECLASLSSFLDGGHRAVKDWYKCRRSTSVDFSDHRSGFRNFNELA